MKPLKAKYTEIVLSLARILPWIFPKWLRYIAKGYSRKELESIQHLYEKEDWLKTASLLDGKFRWKAISVVVKIDHKELDSVRRWLKSNASPGDYNPERDDNAFRSRYDDGGRYRHIGWIHFHKEDRLNSLVRMEIDTKFCDSCYTSISMFSYGINYLSLYFFLKESATEMVCEVDVSEIKRYYSFSSINPLSQQFKAIQHHSKLNIIEDLINKNINIVCADVVVAASEVLKLLGIKKTNSDLVLTADIYRDTDEPYFIEDGETCNKEKSYIQICRKSYGFFDEKISSEPSDNFLSRHVVEKNNLDVLFIKSQCIESFSQFYNFAKNGLALYDSHLFISMFIDVTKKYEEISELAKTALLKNSNKIEKNYDILFESASKLDLLKENIIAIKNDIPLSCIAAYSDSAKKIAEYKLELVDKLKEAINSRLAGLNSEMQIENLRFNRFYSLLVGFLIVIQIALAALTIDWAKYNSKEQKQDITNKAFAVDAQKAARP
ncbi:MAG: hypothetical protein KGZ62_09950 [Sulfurimonas sp.]|nr:hypothetical protein [Sulfurimonas sp.]